MNVFRQLTEKPWLTAESAVAAPPHAAAFALPKARLGLWVFLAVVTVLFMLLIMAYAVRMAFEDWRPGPELGLLWFNTIVLLASSVEMRRATAAARRGRVGDMRSGLLSGGMLALVFLVGQFLAWRQLRGQGTFGMTIPAVAFFYLITGVHALHIVGGLVVWGMTTARVWGGAALAEVRQSIELCTLYWHFMLGVWLVLFGLLFSGNNMSALLAICGIR